MVRNQGSVQLVSPTLASLSKTAADSFLAQICTVKNRHPVLDSGSVLLSTRNIHGFRKESGMAADSYAKGFPPTIKCQTSSPRMVRRFFTKNQVGFSRKLMLKNCKDAIFLSFSCGSFLCQGLSAPPSNVKQAAPRMARRFFA